MNNLTPNYKTLTRIPLFRRAVLQSFPFIEEDFDALTDYELLSKVVEYLNNVIKQQNLVGENTDELLRVYLQLKDYVEHYFDNLDVQDEIDNKIDRMVEQGTLQEIIADYLNSKAIFGFDNVASMKLSTNLIDNSYARTLGYYSKNDGGGSLYKIREITNSDVVDEMTIIAIGEDDLIAELICSDVILPEQLGSYGDGIHDDTLKLQATINYGYNKNLNIKCNKIYYITNTINMVEKNNINLYLNKIIINSDISALNLENTKLSNITINEIVNNNENRVGTAFKLTQNEGLYPDTLVQGNNVIIHWIKNFNKGIYLNVTETTRTNGIQYNHFEFDYIEDCNYCIAFKNYNYHQWINNNYFKGGRMSGLNGIYCEGSQGNDCDVQANVFEGIGFEEFNNIGVNLVNADYNHFIDMRVAEKGQNLQYWIKTTNDCSYNLFHTHSNIDRNYIYDLSDNENIYDSKMYDTFGSVGFGRIYCHSNKFFTDDDYYNYTFSSIWKDFNAYNNDNFTFNNEEVYRNKFLITMGGDNTGVNKSIVKLNDMFATNVNNRHVIKEFYIRCSSFDNDTVMEIRDVDNNVIIDKNSINFQIGHFYKVEKIIQQRPWQIYEI